MVWAAKLTLVWVFTAGLAKVVLHIRSWLVFVVVKKTNGEFSAPKRRTKTRENAIYKFLNLHIGSFF